LRDYKLNKHIQVSLFGLVEGLSDSGALLVFKVVSGEVENLDDDGIKTMKADNYDKEKKIVLEISREFVDKLLVELDENTLDSNWLETSFCKVIEHGGGEIAHLKIEMLPSSVDKYLGRLYVSFKKGRYKRKHSYELGLAEAIIIALKSSAPIFLSSQLYSCLEHRYPQIADDQDLVAPEEKYSLLLENIPWEGFGRYKM